MHLIFEQIALEDRIEEWENFPIPGNVLQTILHDVATYAYAYYGMRILGIPVNESDHLDFIGLQLPAIVASTIELQLISVLGNPEWMYYYVHRFRLESGPSDDDVALQRLHSNCVVLRLCTAWFREDTLAPRAIELHCHCGSIMLRFGRWTRCTCSENVPATGNLPPPSSVSRLAMRLSTATLADRSVIRFSF